MSERDPVLQDLAFTPVAGARPGSPRPYAVRYGHDQVHSALCRARRGLWAAGLLNAVEPVALLSVPGGWRLFATFGAVPVELAARLLVSAGRALKSFSSDFGVVECVLAPRAGPRAASRDPDVPPPRADAQGQWTLAVTVAAEAVHPELPPPPAALEAEAWLRALPGDFADLIPAEGLEPWDAGRPEILAWCTAGAQALYAGVLPEATRFGGDDHRLVGLWDVGFGRSSTRCLNVIERRGRHAVWVRVPFWPAVRGQEKRYARPVRMALERAAAWRELVSPRLVSSRLVVGLRPPDDPWSRRHLQGRVQAMVQAPGEVARVKTLELASATTPWWSELTRWARTPVSPGRAGRPRASRRRPRR